MLVEQGQNQSAGDMIMEVELREDSSQVEQDQNQAPEATHGDVASGTEAFQAEENHLSETAQPDGMPPEQHADEAGQEQNRSNETGRETETLILPSEDSPFSEQHPPIMSSDVPPKNAEQQAMPDVPAPESADLQQAMPDMPALDTDPPGQTAQDESALFEPQFPPARRGKGKARTGAILLVVGIIVVILLAGGAGAFVLLHQNTFAGATSQCAGHQSGCTNHAQGNSRASATHLAFSGTVSGPMTVSAQPRCQGTTMENLHTFMVTLSGMVGGQLYNFGFVINRYLGPGTNRNITTSTTILLDVPGEATNNGWGNASPVDTGNITIARGEQTGSITYVLSGFGSQAGTQVQISGNWTCGG
jgi:hypothetical protein